MSVNQVSIGLDNGLSPIRRQVIIWSVLSNVNWTLSNKVQWNFYQNAKFSSPKIHVNIAGEKVAIFSRGTKQCCVTVNWTFRNKLQWNFNKNTNFSFPEMHLKLSSAKWPPFCPGGRWVNTSNEVCGYWAPCPILWKCENDFVQVSKLQTSNA